MIDIYTPHASIDNGYKGLDRLPFPVMTVHEQARARSRMVMTWPHPGKQIDRCRRKQMGRGVGIWVHHNLARPKENLLFLPTLNMFVCMMSTSTTWRCTRCLR